MNEFIFGTLATSEKRVAAWREQREGVWHGHQLLPIAPQAGDEPIVQVTVGVPASISRLLCEIWQPEPMTFELHLDRVEWDLIGWRYVQIWTGKMPAFPPTTIVRYTLTAYPINGQPIPADKGELFSYRVGEAAEPKWAAEAVIYQIFPDRFSPGEGQSWHPTSNLSDIFGGTLSGIIEKLDYIADLGFNCIWLNPFFPDHTHHGYHATDYFAVNPRLGTMAQMQELVNQAHARGMRVLLDFVANHWGSGHATFQAALADETSEYHDWYFWEEWPHQYKTFFGVRDLPKVNVNHSAARDYLLQAAHFWLAEVGFDGYRLDHAHGVTHDFWVAFRQVVKAAKPDAWIFGEIIESPVLLRTYQGRLDGCLDFLLLQALRDTFAFRTMDLVTFDQFLQSHEAFFPEGYSRPSFLDNHDMNRFLWLVGGDVRRLKLAALCQFTLAGTPVVYYGTEVGLSQERDIRQADGRAVMEECRLPMVWGEEQNKELHDFYRQLIHFRRAHPVLWRGKRQTVYLDERAGIYAYTRSNDQETLLILLNLNEQPHDLTIMGLSYHLPAYGGEIKLL